LGLEDYSTESKGFCQEVLDGQVSMVTMNSNSQPLVELEAEIVELEEAIPDRATWDRSWIP